ncbi:thiamine pyrophosphate-binding protein [Micrococcus sp. ACRRV]|uniref:thiamine pyrophosphate-binding protein n=1 Tax=Micrococcus sp. ACRRV TaxID=2918203 RepID=UPI001EF21F01|nr:thiamine pyrophosphate-binding protein [Micrococcus sp. ACRRV]MCG7422898.1 thiamine pyrophosphate-binding protein [Micrococcus sp. ACRRV]
MSDAAAPRRNGGDLAVETLHALGARTVFGIPGQHALGLFDALSRSPLEFVSNRVENNAAFAADGYARATGEVGVLFLSTGPGALTSLAGLQEAYATGVPMVVIASQIPLSGLGARRKGMLHQLDDQKASAQNVTKAQFTVHHASGIPSAIQDAWAEAVTVPQGPVWVEIPQDVLLGEVMVPPVQDALAVPYDHPPRAELVAESVRWLRGAERVAIVAGGGVRRSGPAAMESLKEVAELLQAPVVCSPGGNTAFPWEHPLSLGGWVEDRHVTELLEDAEVLLVVGSSLGEVTSNYFTLEPRGRLIQVDAEPRVLETNHPTLGVRADAGQALAALADALRADETARPAERPWHGRTSADVVAEVNAKVTARLDAQDLGVERRLLADIRAAVPADMQTFWDMTIAAYWGWNCWDAKSGQFHSAQGAGGLGYAFPAAFGGSVGLAAAGAPSRVLAVAGDGSAMYSLAELAAARQHDADVTWLIVDDGGYGILREYMEGAFGQATATELDRPDFQALAASFGVPAETVGVEDVRGALERAFQADGPNVVVVQTRLAMWAPSHLEAPVPADEAGPGLAETTRPEGRAA